MFAPSINNTAQWIPITSDSILRLNQSYIIAETVTVYLPVNPRPGNFIELIIPVVSGKIITVNPSGQTLNQSSNNSLIYTRDSPQRERIIFLGTGWVFESTLLVTTSLRTSIVSLNYTSSSELNDVFFTLGTGLRTVAWSNPNGVSTSTLLSTTHADYSNSATNLTSTTNIESATTDVASSWFAFDIGFNQTARRIRPTTLIIWSPFSPGGNNNFSHAIRTFSFQGTRTVSAWTVAGVNGATWTTIKSYSGDTRVSNTAAHVPGVFSFTLDESFAYYRYLRISQTGTNAAGNNILLTGRISIYGDIINI